MSSARSFMRSSMRDSMGSSMGKLPKISLGVLLGIIICCGAADILTPYGPAVMDSSASSAAPSADHPFGTDPMGRDLLAMILYGGRTSIFIGLFSGLISTAIAVVYGTISGLAGERISDLLMRISELVMSLPQILIILFLQALWGKTTVISLAVIIGLTGWMQIAKVVRSEVRQIRRSEYVLAVKTMEGGFWYLLWRHLLPNFISSIMFMVVTNIGQAMITESTLSFLGLGLPLTMVSWGGLLSMSQEAMLSGNWWMVILPGLVLIATLVCVTSVGESVRKQNNRLHSHL